MSSKQFLALVAGLWLAGSINAAEVVPPEVEQPGTQPQEAGNFETPDRCDNCHAGYDDLQPENEPATGWRGGPMGNAGRDPIFWATLAIAEQDFDGAGDLCIRCHSAAGWYAGRSTPTDGAGLQAGDDDGVDCDTCHVLTNPNNDEHLGVMNSPYVANCDADPNLPEKCTTTGGTGEGFYGSGMTSIWSGSDKLGPYADADARHQFMQSAFHRSVDFCGTCHDVSNPVVGDLAPGNGTQTGAPHVVSSQDFTPTGAPNIGGPVEEKAAFNNPPYAYGVVERTFSEYKSSLVPETLVGDFNSLPADLQVSGGSLDAAYQAALLAGTGGNFEDGSPRYFSCQSCHMRPVEALGCNKRGAPLRKDLPMHDQTGGNYWFGSVIKYQDANNMLRLGGGLTATQNLAIDLGQNRAARHLSQAADLVIDGNVLRVVNLTGHKLITGYPEGRRMWLNIKWYDAANAQLREDGAYGPIGVSIPNPAGGPDVEVESIIDLEDPNLIIYEAHYAMTQAWANRLVGAGYDPGLVLSYDRTTGVANRTLGQLAGQPEGTYHETFHFALNNFVAEDNRIPPYGMRYDDALLRNALPVPPTQYGGGTAGSVYNYWDEIDLAGMRPAEAVRADITLLYQGTSWEYVQFLHLANSRQNPFLGDEGVNMLEAWINADVPVAIEVAGDRRMVPPIVMKTISWGGGGANQPPTAGDDAYNVDQDAVLTVDAPGVLANDSDPEGGALSAVLAAGPSNGSLTLGADGSFTYTPNPGFSGNDSFTYRAQDDAGAVSGIATVAIAVNAVGTQTVGVTVLQTGLTTGKGKNLVFTQLASFTQGDTVVFRAFVEASGIPVEGAVVTIAIDGPELLSLETGASDAAGIAEASWKTSAPNKRGQGGTAPGNYSAAITGVTAAGFSWDGASVSAAFSISQ